MADRKARSINFKIPRGASLGAVKSAIEQEIGDSVITVFQEIGPFEYLVELSTQSATEDLIENGFDTHGKHVLCHPPPGYYTNVSVLGLKAYISDGEVVAELSAYGEIKGKVIRLKYKADHELAGLENGNRLVRMVLTTPSIPCSLQIDGEFCRIIHYNQIRVCSRCKRQGHSRKNCPDIECRMLTPRAGNVDMTELAITPQPPSLAPLIPHPENQPLASTDSPPKTRETSPSTTDLSPSKPTSTPQQMDTDDSHTTGIKRNQKIDSSDSEPPANPRRSQIHPGPNVNKARPRESLCIENSAEHS